MVSSVQEALAVFKFASRRTIKRLHKVGGVELARERDSLRNWGGGGVDARARRAEERVQT